MLSNRNTHRLICTSALKHVVKKSSWVHSDILSSDMRKACISNHFPLGHRSYFYIGFIVVVSHSFSSTSLNGLCRHFALSLAFRFLTKIVTDIAQSLSYVCLRYLLDRIQAIHRFICCGIVMGGRICMATPPTIPVLCGRYVTL